MYIFISLNKYLWLAWLLLSLGLKFSKWICNSTTTLMLSQKLLILKWPTSKNSLNIVFFMLYVNKNIHFLKMDTIAALLSSFDMILIIDLTKFGFTNINIMSLIEVVDQFLSKISFFFRLIFNLVLLSLLIQILTH